MFTHYRYETIRPKIKALRKEIIGKCKVCNGTGRLPTGKTIDKSNLIFEYIECECCQKFKENKRYLLANLPRRRYNIQDSKFKKRKAINTLTNKQVDVYQNIINKYLEDFSKAKQNGLGLLLFGTPGGGKTTAALRILVTLLNKNIDCYYIYFKDLIGLLLESYSDQAKKNLFKEITNVDVLFIDELSLVGRVTPHMIAEFTSICKNRFENQLPTILLSNYQTTDEIYHNFGAPMQSLLNEAFMPFKFIGKDLREEKYEWMKEFFE